MRAWIAENATALGGLCPCLPGPGASGDGGSGGAKRASASMGALGSKGSTPPQLWEARAARRNTMRRIGIFGGAFNPIHIGHEAIARAFARRALLSELCIIPTGVPYHKDAPDLAPAVDRVAMCQIAAKSIPGAWVSDAEIRRTGPTYTIDTLDLFERRFPNEELWLLIGSDSLSQLHTWKDNECILRKANLAIAARGAVDWGKIVPSGERRRNFERALESGRRVLGGEDERSALAAQTRPIYERAVILDIAPIEASSTAARQSIRQGMDGMGLLNPAVAQYIKDRGLYAAGEAPDRPPARR